ncbi:MAG: DUF6516 family protein, partial [Dehalococcoidia bacterium]
MAPIDVEAYLESIINLFEISGREFLENPAIAVDHQKVTGILEVVLGYGYGVVWTGQAEEGHLELVRSNRLEVTIVVDASGEYPEWRHYRFHFMDREGRCVFRYDNAPHHRGHAFFPHHKHIGPDEQAVDHPLPSLHQIIREI